MRGSRIIPLASLGIVVTVLVVGGLHGGPTGAESFAPPTDTSIDDVELGLGDFELRGLLVDEAGDPVPDAGVTTVQAGRPIWTWSDRDGAFELKDLQPGPLSLRVVALGFEASRFETKIGGSTQADQVQRLILDRPIGAPPTPPALALEDLEGSVQFGPFATPDRGYQILFQPVTAPTDPHGGFPRRARVAQDGTFRIDLLHAGEYRVILLSPDNRGATGPDLLQSATGDPRVITHGIGGDTPRLSLVSTMGAVTGRVTKTPTLDPASIDAPDAPSSARGIRGALIKVERLVTAPQGAEGSSNSEPNPDRVTFRATQSGPDGSFVLSDLQPGQYRLQLVAGRDRRTIDLTIPAGEIVTIDIDLE